MIGAHEAAAFWGMSQNPAMSILDRGTMAMQALDFFGAEYEKREDEQRFELILSIPESDVWPPSLSSMTERQVADLVQKYPDYHFMFVEVVV